jgi:hypothetical protein
VYMFIENEREKEREIRGTSHTSLDLGTPMYTSFDLRHSPDLT